MNPESNQRSTQSNNNNLYETLDLFLHNPKKTCVHGLNIKK
jgi:hypothetical protein